MNNPPYQGVANQLAQYGRFGDSQLVHMNPIEVQMLSRLSPTGQLTRNPQTGQPEAFLPFLAPLLGSFLGTSLLTGAGAGVLGAAGLSSAAAGAIGSGLATAAATGDLEQGILSGITGFGLGQAFGAAGDALSKTGANAATEAATQGVTDAATQAAQTITPTGVGDISLTTGMGAGPSMGPMATAPMESFLPMSDRLDLLSQGLQAPLSSTGTTAAAAPTARDLTVGQRLSAPFQEPGAFLGQLTSPGTFLPAYVGETGRMAREMEQAGRGSMRDYQEQQDAERRKTLAQMSNVFNQVRSAYPNIGYARGGQVEGYFDGGDIENQIRNALNQGGYNAMPDAENVQLALRGAEYVPPPAASYAALDVGGEGYLPGISGEFQYFREPTPPPPAAVDPGSMPGGGDIVGGGYFDPNFDFEGFLNQRGGYRNYLDLFGGGGFQPTMPDTSADFTTRPTEEGTFVGLNPNFDRTTGTYITDGMPDMDFGSLEEFLSQYSPDAAQPAPTSPGTPPPPSTGTMPDFSGVDLSMFGPGFNPDMMGGMPSTRPALGEPEPPPFIPPQMPPSSMPVPQIPPPQIPPGINLPEDSFVARPLPEPTPPGFTDRLSELIAPPQMGPPPVTPPPQMAQPPVPFMPSPQMPQRDQPFELPAAPPGMLGPLPSGGIADLAEQRQRIMPMPPRAEVLPQFGEEELLDDEELLAEMRRRRRPLDRGGFAEGGMTPMEGDMNPMQSDMAPQDELVMMTVAAIRGEIENADEIISAFVDQYGSEAFMQLREQVLQDIVPNAQTEGMVEGMGGGQDDMVEGMIGSQRPVAVSPGEYIIPADAVALAGGGYSGDGAKFFDGLVDDIRQRTMGTTEQVRPYQGRGM